MWLTFLLPGRSFDPSRHGTRLSHRRPTPRRRSVAPRLEVMEDRTVLNTLTVINTNDSGQGSLRQAILNASSGDTINFDSALAGKTITLTSGELDITNNVNIDGSFPSGLPAVTISGNHSSRVFEFARGTSAIGGLIIADGNNTSSPLGGGILNDKGVNLTVSGVEISHNSATKGGGIENDGGTLTVSGVEISHNSAAKGGGIENDGGTLTVSAGDISNNSATKGGGIDNTNAGTVTLDTCNVQGNTASTEGGGIDNTNAGTVTLDTCNVQGNTAPVGPDINGPFTAHNSTVGDIYSYF